ncbi:MAG: M48 family metalloprotease [Pseudomonadota bacterium]
MDFFEAQERARRRSARLIVLFGLAVLALIAGGYFVAVFLVLQLEAPEAWLEPGGQPRYVAFRPDVLFWVAFGTLAVVGIAAGYRWLTFRAGGRVVAKMLGGTAVDPSTKDFKERQLLNVVEEMAIASGTPLPAVYVLKEEAGINAFAAGLTTSDAVVAVTQGALEHLSRDELQGVVAHEFSHILNGDMRLNLKLASTVFGILVIGHIGRLLLHVVSRARFASRGRSSRDGQGLIAVVAVCVVGGLSLMIIGYSGYFFGRLIQAAVSRQREYLADASAVQFTRNPPGLLGALRKIAELSLGSRLMAPAASQFNHAFFGQAFRSLTGLLATHPPLEDRMRAIDPRGLSLPVEARRAMPRAPVAASPGQAAGLGGGVPQTAGPMPTHGVAGVAGSPTPPMSAGGVGASPSSVHGVAGVAVASAPSVPAVRAPSSRP